MLKQRQMRSFALASFTVVISILVSVMAVEAALRFLSPSASNGGKLDPGLFDYHPRLGWVVSRDWRGKHIHSDYRVSYNTNAFGHRGAALDISEQSDSLRYVYLGDSFTFGLGVNDESTFVHLLNIRDRGRRVHLNFGQPGYSTDQEMLFAEARAMRFKPDVVVLMTYLGNDFIDNSLAYPLQANFPKPYFVLENEKLLLHNSPVPKEPKPAIVANRTIADVVLKGSGIKASLFSKSEILKRLGYVPSTYDISMILQQRTGPSIDLFVALVQRLRDFAISHQGELFVALLPGQSFVHSPRSYSAQYQDHLRRAAIERLGDLNVKVLDLASQLRKRYEAGDRDAFFPNDGHLTPKGHRLIADFLEEGLR